MCFQLCLFHLQLWINEQKAKIMTCNLLAFLAVPFIFACALLCFENGISFREKITFLSDAKLSGSHTEKSNEWEPRVENHIFIIFSVSSHFALTGVFCRTSPGWIRITHVGYRARIVQHGKTLSQCSPQYFWENYLFFNFKWDTRNLHDAISSSIETEPSVHFRLLIGK